MADLIDSNELMFTKFEPKMKMRYLMYINGIESFMIKAAARPKFKSSEVTIDYINMQRYLKGKTVWESVSLKLYDPIAPSAVQSVMEWARLGHESVTGRDGYSDFYKRDVKINMLGPVGDKVEEWTYKGAWILDADFGQVDWSEQSGLAEISITIRYDYAILEY